jgi:hypothetical protein
MERIFYYKEAADELRAEAEAVAESEEAAKELRAEAEALAERVLRVRWDQVEEIAASLRTHFSLVGKQQPPVAMRLA